MCVAMPISHPYVVSNAYPGNWRPYATFCLVGPLLDIPSQKQLPAGGGGGGGGCVCVL